MTGKPLFTLSVDLKKCVGHGRCYDVAPGLFAPDDDEGRARILKKTVPQEELNLARLAVESCPEEAITLNEAGKPKEATEARSNRR
jgi:ferredoxin